LYISSGSRNQLKNIGYVRVSGIDQNETRQLAGIHLDKKFVDKCSGKDVARPALTEMLEWVRDGDTLHVHSIDRMARNLLDLQQLVSKITAKGVVLRFHHENLTFSGDDSPMQKLMLQMMGAFAEFERALIRSRQREGILARKLAGLPIGPKPKLDKSQIREVKNRLLAGEAKTVLAKEFGVSRQTIYNVLA
jgi:DNA invertase Pin-like site-specific DNA recombinase